MQQHYTYDSLIGVISITDARGETIYYHYDELNRLEYVKDAQKKIQVKTNTITKTKKK